MSHDPRNYARRQERLARANALIIMIATTGRGFLHHRGITGYLSIQGHLVYYTDPWTGTRRCLHTADHVRWIGFSGGGSMKHLLKKLKLYVHRAEPVTDRTFGPWPDWLGGGDPWAYGDDNMAAIRNFGRLLGILEDGA